MLTKIEAKELKERVNQETEAAKQMDKRVSDYLFNTLQSMTEFKIGPIRAEVEYGNYHEDGWDAKDTNNFEVSFTVRFLTDDKELIDKGTIYDFASDFDMWMSKNRIYINHGCSGSFSSEDKFQVARIKLLANIFDHEKRIIAGLLPVLDLPLLKKLQEDSRASYKYDQDVEDAKRKIEEEKINNKMKDAVGKVLVRYNTEYITSCEDHPMGYKYTVSEFSCVYIQRETPKRFYINSFNTELPEDFYKKDSDWYISKDSVRNELESYSSKLINPEDFNPNEKFIRYTDGTIELLIGEDK